MTSNRAPTIAIQISGRRCSGVSQSQRVALRGTRFTRHDGSSLRWRAWHYIRPIPASDSAVAAVDVIVAGPMAGGLWDTPIALIAPKLTPLLQSTLPMMSSELLDDLQCARPEFSDREMRSQSGSPPSRVPSTAASIPLRTVCTSVSGPLLVLRRFQEAGHRPLVLVGGATGLIETPASRPSDS